MAACVARDAPAAAAAAGALCAPSAPRPGSGHLSLHSINHISKVCSSVEASVAFYKDVLGFMVVKRPQSFEESFEGCWLWRYGLGLHLIKGSPVPRPAHIDPKSDHLSFQADCLEEVEAQLQRRGIPYVRQQVVEDGLTVQQLFFHDPDRNMIEVCNCDCLPIVPIELARCGTCAAEAAGMCGHGLPDAPGAAPHLPSPCRDCCGRGQDEQESEDEAMSDSRDSLDSSRSDATPRHPFTTAAAALAAVPLLPGNGGA